MEGTGGEQPLSSADPGFGGVDLLLTNVTGQVASGFGEVRLQVGFGEITLHAPTPSKPGSCLSKTMSLPFTFFFFLFPLGSGNMHFIAAQQLP